jgi:hypothetical protein
MHRTLAIAFVMAASGCLRVPAPTAPAPLAFHASRPAPEAVQVAAVALMNAGFRVTQGDSIGRVITATRTATHNGNQDFISCALPNGSAAAANRETTITIDFAARPAQSGSDVNIKSSVRTSYPGYEGSAMQQAANETDCVSNGAMEQQLRGALR